MAEEIHNRVQAYLQGDDNGITKEEAARHLDSCPRCKAFAVSLSRGGRHEDADTAAATAMRVPTWIAIPFMRFPRLTCVVLLLFVVLACTSPLWWPLISRIVQQGWLNSLSRVLQRIEVLGASSAPRIHCQDLLLFKTLHFKNVHTCVQKSP